MGAGREGSDASGDTSDILVGTFLLGQAEEVGLWQARLLDCGLDDMRDSSTSNA